MTNILTDDITERITWLLNQRLAYNGPDGSVVKGIAWCELYAKNNINPSEWKPKQLANYLVRQYLYAVGLTTTN